MNKKKVHDILESFLNQQMMAIAGGVIGGKESEKLANQDLKMYADALHWFENNE
jgi:hypothetical protein